MEAHADTQHAQRLICVAEREAVHGAGLLTPYTTPQIWSNLGNGSLMTCSLPRFLSSQVRDLLSSQLLGCRCLPSN